MEDISVGEAKRRKKLLGSEYGKPSSHSYMGRKPLSAFSRQGCPVRVNRIHPRKAGQCIPQVQVSRSERFQKPQVAIFAQTNGEIKETKLSRPPIPEVEYLKFKLNSVELRDWLIAQWSSLVMFETPEDGDEIASLLLGKLGSKFSEDLNSDFTITYKVSPLVEISVGINVYRWTVWGSVIDRSKGCCFVTSDGDEFQLSASSTL